MDQLSYGSDLGKDVRIQYIDALRRGKDSTELNASNYVR